MTVILVLEMSKMSEMGVLSNWSEVMYLTSSTYKLELDPTQPNTGSMF